MNNSILENDIAANISGTVIPFPCIHIPSTGDIGVNLGGTFYPIEFVEQNGNKTIRDDEAPLLSVPVPAPSPYRYDQPLATKVAGVGILPYNHAALPRTVILDTVPDAAASDEDKALPNYFPNPGITLYSRTQENFLTVTTINAEDIVADREYTILTVGDTDFTAIGAASNDVGVSFTATGAGTGTGTATYERGLLNEYDGIEFRYSYVPDTGGSDNDPHPALRVGQSRYSVSTTDATGTVWDGVPFLPMENPISGTLWTRAYRRGMLLSDRIGYTITVKIGRGKAEWDATAQTLTLSTPTTSATIRYRINGGSEQSYSAPLSITDTATVTWYAQKTFMTNSDTFSTYIEYQDEAPPEDFDTDYFSTLDAIEYRAAIKFPVRPDWYVTVDGTGDGRTPDDPASLQDIVGVLGVTTGRALGPRTMESAYINGTNGLRFQYSTGFDSTFKVLYSLDGTEPSNVLTFSGGLTGFILPDRPSHALVKFQNAAGIDVSGIYHYTLFVGGAKVLYDWNATTKLLTLSLVDPDDDPIVGTYTITAEGAEYTEPILVESTTTFSIVVSHAKDSNIPTANDFATAADSFDLPTIDPNSTGDFSGSESISLDAPTNVSFNSIIHGNDIIWCAEGTYECPTEDYNQYFYSTQMLRVMGGFSADFAERDVVNRKTIITASTWGSGDSANRNRVGISLANGVLDGIHGNIAIAEQSYYLMASEPFWADFAINCHVDVTLDYTSHGPGYMLLSLFGNVQNCINCTANLVASIGAPTNIYNSSIIVGGFSGQMTNCRTLISISGGDGVGANILESLMKFDGIFGQVKNSTFSIQCYPGNNTRSNAQIIYRGQTIDSDVELIAVAQDASNTDTNGTITMYDSMLRCNVSALAVSGNGADQPSGSGGWSRAEIFAQNLIDCDVALSAEAGSGGVGWDSSRNYSLATVHTRSVYAPPERDTYFRAVNGLGGADSRGYVAHGTYNQPANTDQHYFANEPYIEEGDVASYAPGNYARTDSTNWNVAYPFFSGDAAYAGMVGGDGAPIDGYETPGTGPGGAGTARGKYWE